MDSIKISYATYKDRDDWNDFVYSHKDSTYSHVFEWRDIIGRTYGLKSKYLIFYVGQEIVGVLPLVFVPSIFGKGAWISVPFTNYGGILAKDEDTLFKIDQLIINKVPFRDGTPIKIKKIDRSKNTEQSIKVTSILRLETEEHVWSGFKSKLRTKIRRSIKNGFAVSNGLDKFKSFYNEIYFPNMHRLGTPHHPIRFFNNITAHYPYCTGFIAIIDKEKIIAGMFFLILNDKFYDLISLTRNGFEQLRPIYQLYWESMQFAMTNDCKEFDFGRSTVDAGVFKFKQQWGPEVFPIYNTVIRKDGDITLNNNTYENPFYNICSKLWQKTPSIITNSVGPAIRKYLP